MHKHRKLILKLPAPQHLAIPFDRVAEAYDSTRALSSEIMAHITDSMKEVLVDCQTVLDVGVGTGRFAHPLSEKGFQVVGTDVSLPMMLKAKQKGLNDLVRADARKLPFHDRTFDSALIVHLLHLVDDWAKVVHEVGRVVSLFIVSLVGASSGFRIRREYLRLREEMGRPLKRLNNAEEGLRSLLPPERIRFVGEYTTTVNSEVTIASLEKGDFAISWDLPEGFHSRIIAKLRSEYGDKNYSRTDKYEIALWTPEQFRRFRQT
jgi:SAM-dependent methyltransferase